MDEYARMLQGMQPDDSVFMTPRVETKPYRRSKAVRPMTAGGQEIAARFKEIFFAYDNRRTEDNRSAQTHLGPSEIGTPCDRKLALSLMRRESTRLGNDGWAAFVGTCGHAGLDQMYLWHGAGTGRYLREVEVTFPSAFVPRGRLDLFDRMTKTVIDFKFMGSWSLDNLKANGPSQVYQVQIHTYGMGLSIQGEDVRRVAIVGCPRASSSLDDMYVWEEPYNPQIARDALARVEKIGKAVWDGVPPEQFDVADDCKFCPFYRKSAQTLEDGCNGRK